jgi:hypothetical protein
MMVMHKEMEVQLHAFLTSPLVGGAVSLMQIGKSPQFPLERD